MSGGASTVYGLLYQVLGSLEHAFVLRNCQLSEDQTVESAVLILEPRDGGDVAFSAGGRVVVEQWKSRRSTRNWTLRDILKATIPDLFLATDGVSSGVYRVRLEGVLPDWSAAETFFHSLPEPEPAGLLSESLDDTHPQQFLFGSRGHLTQRAFFLWLWSLVSEACKKRKLALTPEELELRLVRLLRGFEIPAPQSAAQIRSAVDGLLRDYVDYTGDIEAVRSELCGRLLELSAEGNRRLTPKELLDDAGLMGTPLFQWRCIRDRLNLAARTATNLICHYDAELDVRSPLIYHPDASVLALAGESGDGKSWQLATVAHRQIADRATVLLRSTGSVEEDIRAIERAVWHCGANRDTPPVPITNLGQRLKRSTGECWLNVLVDDVRSSEVARRLAEQPWRTWGIQLAMTVPTDVGGMLAKNFAKTCVVVHPGDFAYDELRNYLRLRGRRWTDLPADVRAHIRKPLLARIYCDVNAEEFWNPRSEYEIFSGFWAAISSHPSQSAYPDDRAGLLALGEDYLLENSQYPWSVRACRECGLDSDAVTRLVRLGWLVRRHSRVEIGHTRLLSWLIAEVLADRLRVGDDDVMPLVQHIITEVIGNGPDRHGQELGYTFMDLLWLVTGPGFQADRTAPQVLEAIESVFAARANYRMLYRENVATLGERGLKPVVTRLANIPAEDNLLRHPMSVCLYRIVRNLPTWSATSLLSGQPEPVQMAAVEIVKRRPEAAVLPMLWDRYQELRSRREDEFVRPDDRQHRLHDCRQAIAVCAPLDTSWLCETINKSAGDQDAIWTLSGVLSQLDSTGGSQDIWQSVRSTIIETRRAGCEHLAACIRRFRDIDSVELMARWVQAEQTRGHRIPAYETLCLLAPDQALDLIDTELVTLPLFGWSTPWFDVLDRHDPSRCAERLRVVAEGSASGAAAVARVYVNCSHRLPRKTFRVLVQTLAGLAARSEEEVKDSRSLLFDLLTTTASVATQELLDECRSLARGDIERRLATMGCHWAESGYNHLDREFRMLGDLLLRIRGEGLTRLVNTCLTSANPQLQYKALEWSKITGDEETIRLLTELSLQTPETGEKQSLKGVVPGRAIEALVCLGRDHLAVTGVLANPGDVRTLCWLREGRPPLTDDVLAPVLDRLREASPGRENAFYALAISGRQDLIPDVQRFIGSETLSDLERVAALWTLCGLRAADDKTVEIFKGHIDRAGCGDVSTIGLLTTERADARHFLLQSLRSCSEPGPFTRETWLPFALLDYEDCRAGVLEFIANATQEAHSFRSMWRPIEFITHLGEVRTPEVKEILLQEAGMRVGNFRVTGRRREAIRALHGQDATAALEAAWAAFGSDREERHLYPSLMMKLAPQEALNQLLRGLPEENNRLVRRAILVELRRSCAFGVISAVVERWLSGPRTERVAAAEVLGWVDLPLADQWLAIHSENEPLPGVRSVFYQSQRLREREHHARCLIECFAERTTLEQFAVVDALFSLVPPEWLAEADGPLAVGIAAANGPPHLHDEISDRNKKEMKAVTDGLKSPAFDDDW